MTQFIAILRFLVGVLPCLLEHGGSITSWLRTPAHNTDVGGAADSRHKDGTAMDIVHDTKAELEGLARALQAKGLRVRDEGDHLHVDDRTWR